MIELQSQLSPGSRRIYHPRYLYTGVFCAVLLGLFCAPRLYAVSATATVGQSVTLSVTASGTQPFTYQWYKSGSALPQSNTANYVINSVTAADTGTYAAVVSNSVGSTNSDVSTLNVISAVVAPSIQTQPSSLTISSGALATFSVVASGSAPLTYQWMKAGVPISGATSSTLSLLSVLLADAGSYSVKISNAAGSVISNTATLTVSLVAPPPVSGNPPPVSAAAFTDASFESVNVSNNGFYSFAYNPIVSGWTYSSYAGLSGNGSGFTSGNPNAPGGSQVAFIQNKGWMLTQVNFPAGTYSISASVANRANWGVSQVVVVYIDGTEVGRFSANNWYTTVTTNSFTVAAGSHSISFVGQATNDGTLFLDLLTINGNPSAGVTVGNSGFERPDLGANSFSAYQYTPATIGGSQDWVFQGYAGIAANNSGFTSGNPSAPEGKQVGFVQMTGTMAQTVAFPSSGTYQLTVSAAQRLNWGQPSQTLQVYLDSTYIGSIAPAGGSYQSIKIGFSASAGNHQLSFRGTATTDGTVFLDQIQIQ